MTPSFLPALGSILAVSAASFAGVALLSLRKRLLHRILLFLVAFSTGALLGNVFLHLFPEMLHDRAPAGVFPMVIGGMLLSFIIEKFVHWHHHHDPECERHVHAAGPLILIGDGVHNLLDGMLIATAYLVSPAVGIATTIAVLLHEIPQEMGDFGVLVHSGYSRGQALLLNGLSALMAVIGGVAVFLLADVVDGLEEILLPIAAGNLLYIAAADLIPELHKELRPRHAVLQLLFMLAGIGLLYGLSLTADPHEAMEESHVQENTQ